MDNDEHVVGVAFEVLFVALLTSAGIQVGTVSALESDSLYGSVEAATEAVRSRVLDLRRIVLVQRNVGKSPLEQLSQTSLQSDSLLLSQRDHSRILCVFQLYVEFLRQVSKHLA